MIQKQDSDEVIQLSSPSAIQKDLKRLENSISVVKSATGKQLKLLKELEWKFKESKSKLSPISSRLDKSRRYIQESNYSNRSRKQIRVGNAQCKNLEFEFSGKN